jgi:hypothetical protein
VNISYRDGLSGLFVNIRCRDGLSGLFVNISCMDGLSGLFVNISCRDGLSGWFVNISCRDGLKGCNVLSYYDTHFYCRYLENVKGFEFTPRSREDLPQGFPEDVPGICYFLDGYTYHGVSTDKDVDHISLGLKSLPICN